VQLACRDSQSRAGPVNLRGAAGKRSHERREIASSISLLIHIEIQGSVIRISPSACTSTTTACLIAMTARSQSGRAHRCQPHLAPHAL